MGRSKGGGHVSHTRYRYGMHTAVPYAAAARASAGRRLRHSILVARCFSLFFDCFIAANKRQPLPGIHLQGSHTRLLTTASPLLRHQLQSPEGLRSTQRKKKRMASSADLEIQCLADAAAYIERHGWPRSRLEGWRCAPVPRVSNPAHWDPYATVSPPSRHRRDSRIAGTGSARTRKSRGAPSLSSRWSRTLCSARLVRRCGACRARSRASPHPIRSRTTGTARKTRGTRPSLIGTPCVEINQCVGRVSGRTRRKILISTKVTPPRRTRARRSSP